MHNFHNCSIHPVLVFSFQLDDLDYSGQLHSSVAVLKYGLIAIGIIDVAVLFVYVSQTYFSLRIPRFRQLFVIVP